MVLKRGEAGCDNVVRQLHARSHRGELTFRAVAAALRLSVRELYELCEQKGLADISGHSFSGRYDGS